MDIRLCILNNGLFDMDIAWTFQPGKQLGKFFNFFSAFFLRLRVAFEVKPKYT